MKKVTPTLLLCALLLAAGCTENEQATGEAETTTTTEQVQTGQSGVQEDLSNPNIVQIAAKSPDHTTLVTAVKTAGLVDALANAGPFTVFAPVNGAFDKLPAGTVE